MGGPDDWLPLSGIQHFCFCRRQWALIHLEQQWAENRRTVEGQLDHARCHDANQTERRDGLLITRGMQVVSRRLGLSGNCDVVEFRTGTEMGRKHIVPYALYRAEGYVSANLARKTTGFSEDDLKLLWTAILNMFENDHSAARGKMAVRELIVFKHDSELGNAPAYKLFDSVTVQRKPDVDAARSYRDYTVTVADTLPEGVTCERLS